MDRIPLKKIPLTALAWYLRNTQFLVNISLTRHKLRRYAGSLTGSVLDIGAGEQPYRKYFRNISTYTATNTKRHYDHLDPVDMEKFTDVWIEDGTRLPFEEGAFDGVVSFQVMSVISRPEDFFMEMNRVLKPGGLMLLATDFLYPKWSSEDVMRHTDLRLRQLAESHGFEVIRLESYGGFWTMLYSLGMRYIRSYPGAWKMKRNLIAKVVSGLLYLPVLLLQPLFSLCGWLIYLGERNKTAEFDYTMNNMLVARKVS